MKVLFTGIQPTGDIHIGNYFGAIANWVRIQHDYVPFISIVDLHAITIPYEAAEMPSGRRTCHRRSFRSTRSRMLPKPGGWSAGASSRRKSGPSWATGIECPPNVKLILTSAEWPP